MGNTFLNKKGQISIEFILIILIALIYIHSVMQPTVSIASQSTEDVTRLSQAKLAAQKLAVAINQLHANQADGKKTISVFVPQNSLVECDAAANRINFSTTVSKVRTPPQNVCQGFECGGFIKLIDGANPNCTNIGNEINAATGNVFRELVIVKDSEGLRVDYAI